MKGRKIIFSILSVLVVAGLVVGVVLADDSIMFRRNISKTPEGETEKAGIAMMYFTIPPQASDGTVLDVVEYVSEDGTVAHTSPTAKPLVAVYIDDIHFEEELAFPSAQTGGMTFGHHDTFIGHSLDDGSTWKTVNISRAADLSSFNLANGHAYPGDSYAAVHAIAGNRVMVAWLSRYCDGGSPLYTLAGDDTEYDETLQSTYALPDMYVQDIWGVMGTQKSVDYTLQGFPEVGEIPYGCVWTARGTLMQGDFDKDTNTGDTYDILWTKAERLTSGVRDPNRLEIDAVQNVGFVITWQEDPEGLRPGQGLGPGEGWSGAIVNAKTDVWYSYLDWDHFGLVDTDGDLATIEPATAVELYEGETQPKPAVPMAMPVRLTDNNMCKATNNAATTGDDYCHASINTDTGEIALDTNADFCAETYSWTNPGGTTIELCKAPDGRIFNGRVGASRPRISLQPYDENADGINDYAYLIMAYEETKALGDILIEGTEDPIEIGKNIWYHSFDMFKPEVVSQGGMLNQPSAFNPETLAEAPEGEFLTIQDEFDYTVYQTEIARRFSLIAQPYAKIGPSRTAAYLLYKQGILNQGGPADIFARRIVAPEETEDDPFDPAVDNPYAFENMVCSNWIVAPGTNPNYLKGLCGDAATNLSATTNDLCYPTASADEPSQECVDDFPWDGNIEDFPKISFWGQTEDTLDDQSWENPFDVAKGHRGFIDGDFLMVLYAWSPNWKANSVGNDKYNLYVRRSFDGGTTWTTTPASYTHTDGITYAGAGTDDVCENFGIGGKEITRECTTYGPGVFEPARNVSQLIGTKVTVLDPRYTPTGGLKKLVVKEYTDSSLTTAGNFIEEYDKYRDPSKFFIVYETGDNTTAAEGEPTPLDLFYSRGTNFGDVYEYDPDYDADNINILEEPYRWPWLEKNQDDLSGEAALTANPGGQMMYGDWNQWREEDEVIFDSDVWFRRLFYNEFTETQSIATILYTGPIYYSTDAEIVLIGSARDTDQLGDGDQIVEYEWSVDGVVVGNLPLFRAPANTLSDGWHVFSFRVKDNEGVWSDPATISLYVGDMLYIRLPVVVNP